MTTIPGMAKRIELWPLDRLIHYPSNVRTHSEEQVAQIAASIREFGFNKQWKFCTENDCYAVDSEGHVFRVYRQQKESRKKIPIYDYMTIYILHQHCNFSQRKLADMNRVGRQAIGTVIKNMSKLMEKCHA